MESEIQAPPATEPEPPPQPALEPGCEGVDGPWWHLLAVYTRDWIHYGAITFFVFLIVAAAVRGLFAR